MPCGGLRLAVSDWPQANKVTRMSPVATLIILGIASVIWFAFLRGHLAGNKRNNSDGGGDVYSSDSSDRHHDTGGHDAGDGGGDGGDGGGD